MTAGAGRKVLVISGWGATVLATLVSAAILASAAYAWNANADLRVLQRDVGEIKQANLPIEIAALKEQVKAATDASNRVERKQDKMDDKLDMILSKKN